jgi:hypothetical protein
MSFNPDDLPENESSESQNSENTINFDREERPSIATETIEKFDANTEITEEDWKRIIEGREEKGKKIVGNIEKVKSPELYLQITSNLQTISPDKFREYRTSDNFDKRGEMSDKISTAIKELQEAQKWGELARLASGLQSVFPEKMPEINGDKLFAEEKKYIDEQRATENPHWPSVLAKIERLAIMFPEKTGELRIDEKVMEQIENQIKHAKKTESWDLYANQLARYKILFPEQSKDTNADQSDMDQMRAKLESLRLGADFYGREDLFSQMARDMKLATSENIKITDKGLKVE